MSAISSTTALVRKFFLHVSREEQKRGSSRGSRSREELEVLRRGREGTRILESVHGAYEDAIRATATQVAVVRDPGGNKWFTRVIVGAAVIETLDSLGLHYPEVGPEKLRELAAVKKALLAE